MDRVSIDDLYHAEDACARVANWIKAEIERRQLEAAIRQVKTQVPSATRSQIKAAIARTAL